MLFTNFGQNAKNNKNVRGQMYPFSLFLWVKHSIIGLFIMNVKKKIFIFRFGLVWLNDVGTTVTSRVPTGDTPVSY